MNKRSIRDRLLEIETRTPSLEEKFKKEMKKMLGKKLTSLGKIVWAITLVIAALLVIRFFHMAIVLKDVPWLVRVGFVEGAVFSAAWVALSAWILKKGSFRLFQHENVIHGLVFIFVLLLLIHLFLLGGQIEDRTKGIQMMLSGGIFFLIFGIPAIFIMRINRTESSLREQMLKIELRIAELSEKMEG
jgi:hypothetical protein